MRDTCTKIVSNNLPIYRPLYENCRIYYETIKAPRCLCQRSNYINPFRPDLSLKIKTSIIIHFIFNPYTIFKTLQFFFFFYTHLWLRFKYVHYSVHWILKDIADIGILNIF